MTRELERVKRAKSHHDEPLSPESSLASITHSNTPPSGSNDRFGTQVDAASAFGLNALDTGFSQVSSQILGVYHLSGFEIATLFRK